jgi:8-oxo-dGTP pyrophosphatase MutT (NUDIX family)
MLSRLGTGQQHKEGKRRMKPGKIRPLAIGIIWKGSSLLVFEGHDPVKDETFYRPLGGAIEFGEYSPEALLREFREELGAELVHPRYLATLENVFVFGGQAGHEIVLVYEAEFQDRSLYEREHLDAQDDDGPMPVLWKPLADFAAGGPPLYPEGLYALLYTKGR